MNFENSKTKENLQAALSGESMARNKYTFYAMAARKAGYEKIADDLERMAQNEMAHAKFWFEQLYGKPDDVQAMLKEAAAGELSEWKDMYPRFAAQAREEGLENIAAMFESVARIERDHENQFMRMLVELAAGKKEGTRETAPAAKQRCQGYRCMFCGAVFDERPDVCSVCQAIGSFENCEYEE